MIVEVAIEPADGAYDPVRAALADIARSLDLSLIDDGEIGQLVVGSRREELLQAALALLAERCPTQYRAGVIVPVPVISIHDPVDVTFDYKRQNGGSGAYASVSLSVSPREGMDLEFLDECPKDNLPPAYRAAVAQAVAREEARNGLGWSLAAMTIRLKDAKYHDLDSSPEAFAAATHGALRETFFKGRSKFLEPVVAIAIVAPAGDLDACARLLRDRGVDSEVKRGDEADSIIASARMIDLLGFAGELRAATAGQADYAITLTGYVGVTPYQDPLDTEPMAAALRA